MGFTSCGKIGFRVARGFIPGLEFLHFGEGGYIQNLRNARVFWSHRSDALYQGMTSVVPLKVNKRHGLYRLRKN
jgi:hypothetical protein